VIDGTISTSGHPILLGGPQAGYFDPQILVENELHGDRIHARGAGFPGMGFVVIGRNANAAWTPTAGGSDMIDIYVEELCEPSGGAATEDSLHYLYNGSCVAMDRRVHRTLDAAPIGLPGRELLPEIIVERTVHGTVVARGKIGDKPVAVSRKRSTYMKELDAAICILRLNRNEVPNGETFVREFTRSMNLSTNWTYANANEIAYVHGGLYPVRPAGAHPDLPVWGTGNYEWRRDPGLAHVERIKDPATDNDDVYLSDLASPEQLSLHPHEVRPERHYIVSWNNRPAPDWSASDADWGWSSIYRADLLEDLVQNEIAAGRKISPTRLVQIMEHAGLSDLRGTHVLPQALAILSHADAIGPNAAHRIAVLQAWAAGWTDFANARGPLRRDGDRDGEYDQAEAAGIMDAWWDPMIHAIFDPGLGGRDVSTVSLQGFHNAPWLDRVRVPGRLLRPGARGSRARARRADRVADLADLLWLDGSRHGRWPGRVRERARCLARGDLAEQRERAQRADPLPADRSAVDALGEPADDPGTRDVPRAVGRDDARRRSRARRSARATTSSAPRRLTGALHRHVELIVAAAHQQSARSSVFSSAFCSDLASFTSWRPTSRITSPWRIPPSLAGPSGSTDVTTTPLVSSRPSCSASSRERSCTASPNDLAPSGGAGVADVFWVSASGSSSSAIFGCSTTRLPSRITEMSTFLFTGVDATIFGRSS
jgi:hypothetical protein